MPLLPLLALLLTAPGGPGTAKDRLAERVFAGLPRGGLNEIMPGRLLVKLAPAAAHRLIRDTYAADAANPSREKEPGELVPGGRVVSQIGASGWTLWSVPADADVRALAAQVRRRPGVVAAEPSNRIYPLIAEPNDPDWSAEETSEALILYFGDGEATPFLRRWHLDDSNALAGWSVWPNRYYTAANKPRNAPLVAIIDTGCDVDHPDFANAGGTSSDAAQGGQIERSLSARFTLGQTVPNTSSDDFDDLNGHGTHVAGLALAAGNSGPYAPGDLRGTLGTGYACRGMILRVFDDNGVGTDADAAAAIYYAADHGAEVINLSLGTENFSQLFQDAVTYAFQKGSLVVCAGNEDGSGGGDLGPIYPAACSGALGVSANGPGGVPATGTYSGTGTYVDIAAPGGDLVQTDDQYTIQFVYSTSVRGDSALANNPNLYPPYTPDYAYLAGTSMATPLVSGAAGLYYGKNGLRQNSGWSNVRAYRALERSAVGLMGAAYGGWEPTQGYGALDMESLLLDGDPRLAEVGAIEGILYFNGTALGNVAVRAKRAGSTLSYSTTTRPDGGYRFEALPPGVYTVTAAPFGALKTRNANVLAGSDATGLDLWAGSYIPDDTPPTAYRFNVGNVTATGFTLGHWAYDTETGINRMSVRVGTAPGGTNLMADTELFPETPVYTATGLNLPRFNSIQTRYTNANFLTTTMSRTVQPTVADATVVTSGPSAATNLGGGTQLYVGFPATAPEDLGYLKLDLSALPSEVRSAVLTLKYSKLNGTNVTGVLKAYATSSDWTETGIKGDNAPPAGTVIATAQATAKAGLIDLDLGPYVRAQKALGRTTASIVLRNATTGSLLVLTSREGPVASSPALTTVAKG